jgi:hypothetical protein
MSQVNFSAFEGGVTSTAKARMLATIAIMSVFIGLATLMLGVGGSKILGARIPVLMIVVVVCGIGSGIYFARLTWLASKRVEGELKSRILGFASQNNWDYVGSARDSSHFPVSVLHTGLCSGYEHQLSGALGNDQFFMTNYKYETGGKNSSTRYYTVFALQTKKTYPHISLENVKKNYSGPLDLEKLGVELRLEGDFGSYFKVRVDKDSEQDALRF